MVDFFTNGRFNPLWTFAALQSIGKESLRVYSITVTCTLAICQSVCRYRCSITGLPNSFFLSKLVFGSILKTGSHSGPNFALRNGMMNTFWRITFSKRQTLCKSNWSSLLSTRNVLLYIWFRNVQTRTRPILPNISLGSNQSLEKVFSRYRLAYIKTLMGTSITDHTFYLSIAGATNPFGMGYITASELN